MRATPDQIERHSELKRQLIEFADGRRFRKALQRALDEAEELHGPFTDDMAYTAFVDTFALRHPLDDGRTIVDHFLAAHPELSAIDTAMVRGWRDYVDGVFEIQGRDGDALVALNLVDDMTYRIRSNMGSDALRAMPKRSFVCTRITPIFDDWLVSGLSQVLPRARMPEACVMAAQLSLVRPRAVFRNPEKLARGWELQAADRQVFLSLFGADEIVLPGPEARARMLEFSRLRTKEGLTPDLDPSSDVYDSKTVGIMYPETEGLFMFSDYADVEAAFADPELIRDKLHRSSVRTYLKDDWVPPVLFNRLADRDPAKASRVFQLLLNSPEFTWEADGEALLRRHKPHHFAEDWLPAIIPLSRRLRKYLD